MKYRRSIRVLHALFGVGITLQLLLSSVMRQPRPGRARTAFEALSFATHEYVGVALIAVLLAHWLLHVISDARSGVARFFPWFSRERMRRLAIEAKALVQLRLGAPETQDTIAGAFQGLGLVIATLLALTGGLVYAGMADDGTMSETIRAMRRVHTTLAPLMWGYLGIHIAATLAHVTVGHRSILAIFRLGAG
jgi:cytochrome b561